MPIDSNSSKTLFDGLKIMDSGEQYTKEMKQYPIIMLTLKSTKQPNFDIAYKNIQNDIASEYKRHNYVLNNDNIFDTDKKKFCSIRDEKASHADYVNL